jgi:hypothetical protein
MMALDGGASLYKREEFPLFDNRFPVVRQAKRGQGRFSQQYVFSIMDSLANFSPVIASRLTIE